MSEIDPQPAAPVLAHPEEMTAEVHLKLAEFSLRARAWPRQPASWP